MNLQADIRGALRTNKYEKEKSRERMASIDHYIAGNSPNVEKYELQYLEKTLL